MTSLPVLFDPVVFAEFAVKFAVLKNNSLIIDYQIVRSINLKSKDCWFVALKSDKYDGFTHFKSDLTQLVLQFCLEGIFKSITSDCGSTPNTTKIQILLALITNKQCRKMALDC